MDRNNLRSFGDWKLGRQLGQGGFGEVHLWQNKRTHQEIATKRLRENPNMSLDEIKKVESRWLQEFKWTQNLLTEFIVHGVDIKDEEFLNYLNKQHAWSQLPVIVMEYCNGGDLRAQLQKIENTNGLTEYEVRQALYTLRHAVEYLHTECHIEHRDLKPDNVVIHLLNGKRVYKLTDFGFARSCTDNTMLKSIVGTRNYVAPEMLDTARYNNTVDYWSMGIIAFELICGKLPFIPHQRLVNIITSIRKKPSDCIAITEDSEKCDKFHYHSKVFAENRMSSVFLSRMEKWLRAALEFDYKKRGRNENGEMIFYSDLDRLLASKVLTVFCLNTYKFYSYEVTEETTMQEWCAAAQKDTNIDWKTYFLAFPTGHPRSTPSSNTKPIDFFVDEFQDTSNTMNPPVMLYILGIEADFDASTPYVSELLKEFVNYEGKVPDWLLQIFEQHTHFLLNNEQRHLEAYLTGLKEIALTIEDAILKYDSIHPMLTDMIQLKSFVDCFSNNVDSMKKVHSSMLLDSEEFFKKWTEKARVHGEEIGKLEQTQSVKKRYDSVLRRSREQAAKTLYDKLIKDDIYGLEDFRHQLETNSQSKDFSKRLKRCQNSIYNCLEKRREFVNNTEVKSARSCIIQVQLEFIKIKYHVSSITDYIAQYHSKIQNDIEAMHKELKEAYTKLLTKNGVNERQTQSLNYDGNAPLLPESITDSLIKSSDLLYVPLEPIIAEISETLLKFNKELDNGLDSIPTVIEEE